MIFVKFYLIIVFVAFTVLIGSACGEILHLHWWWDPLIGWVSATSGTFLAMAVYDR